MALRRRPNPVAWGTLGMLLTSVVAEGYAFAQAPPQPAPAPPEAAPPTPQGNAAPSAAEAASPAGTAAEPAAETPAPAAEEASPDSNLGQVTVTSEREATIQTGPLGKRTILETPFSVGKADSKQISRVAATTIDAAFGYDASIRSNNTGVASGNTFSVRGQSVDLTFGYKYDGLAFPYWFQDQPIEAMEEIQVLKGAGGFVYGYASPSGVVNFVSKRPTKEFQTNVNLSYRTTSVVRALLDIGGPVAKGSKTAFRLNAVHEEGTLYNGAYNRNQFVSLWLQGEIAPKLTWSTSAFYQRTWQQKQSNGISFGPNVTSLAPVSGRLNLGAPATTKWNDITQVTGRLKYEISPDWNASVAVRHSVLDERFPGNTVRIDNNAGDYTLGLLNQNRLFYYNVGQASIDGRVDTGPVEHNLVLGADYLDVNFDYDFQPYVAIGRPTTTYSFGLTGNLYSTRTPDWGTDPKALAFQRPPDWFRYEEIRTRGVFASDTAKFGKAELLAGVRYTSFIDRLNEPVPPSTKEKETTLTPVVALSYDIFHGGRAYASYVEALQRGTIAPPTAINAGDTLGPLKSRQFEAGVKAQRQQWGGTLAAYRTTVPSDIVTTPPAGETLGRFVRDGERRYQGIEIEAHVQPTREWFVNASTAFLDAKQTKSADPTLVGKQLPGPTPIQASAYLQYSPAYVPGLSAFGGIRYTGKAYGQAKNTFTFAAAAVEDAGLSYKKTLGTNQLQLSANVQNIADHYYWVPTATGTGLSAGAPRTFSFSVGLVTGKPDEEAAAAGVGEAPTVEAVLPKNQERRDFWYFGLEAGAAQLAPIHFDVRGRVTPGVGAIRDGVIVKHNVGFEYGAAVGRDFGLFRSEFEFSEKQATLSQVKLRSSQIPIDSTTRPAGTYDNPGGDTQIISFLFNGLLDFGADGEQTPWGVQAGVGAGLARIRSHRWELEDNPSRPNDATRPSFQNDLAVNLAWQVLAGVRRRINDTFDVTLKYRYFNLPNLNLFTSNANEIQGTFQSHSVHLGTNINF